MTAPLTPDRLGVEDALCRGLNAEEYTASSSDPRTYHQVLFDDRRVLAAEVDRLRAANSDLEQYVRTYCPTPFEKAEVEVVAYLDRQRKIDDHYVPRHGDVLRCESPSGPTRPAVSTVAVYRDYAGDGVGAYWACDGTEIHEEQETVLAEAVEILYRRPS